MSRPVRFTVADAMTAVRSGSTIARPCGRTFRELVADCEDRIHVVVRFLALLELYRDGRIELPQGATFGEIEVEWTG